MSKVILPIFRSSCSNSRLLHVSCCNSRNHYDVLGLNRNATKSDIKSAYYEKAKELHPDAQCQSKDTSAFQELSEAYETLSDTEKRSVYDKETHWNHGGQQWTGYDTRPRKRKVDNNPINMNHIHQVYRTMNREDKIFEDSPYRHDFNRFSYKRRWDPIEKRWYDIDDQRSFNREYTNRLRQGRSVVNLCISVVLLGWLFYGISYQFMVRRFTKESSRQFDPRRSGMYVLHPDKPDK